MIISKSITLSKELNKEMEYRVYGTKGKPVLVFPTSCAKSNQYEDFGMIETIKDYIEHEKIQVWTCDGIDDETFLAKTEIPSIRMRRHEQYDKYIVNELIPEILITSKKNNSGLEQKLLTTGCSMGGYHSANFFFRHPEFFDSLIALSGVYDPAYFLGKYTDEIVYMNSPLKYLKDLKDPLLIKMYSKHKIYICCGQGAYEEQMIKDTTEIKKILENKNIPAMVDLWGKDVNHDWPWWKKQIVYFLDLYFTKLQ
jgi:esterase/lipase superfamily enzyme